MKRLTSKMLIPVVTAVISVVFISLGYFAYGFWHPTVGTLPGFFPVVIGLLLFGTSVLVFLGALKEEETRYPVENWYRRSDLAVILLLAHRHAASLAIFVLLWLRGFEKYSWKTTLTVFSSHGVVIGAFVLWLGVPFPRACSST
jgi:hypothetical protein